MIAVDGPSAAGKGTLASGSPIASIWPIWIPACSIAASAPPAPDRPVAGSARGCRESGQGAETKRLSDPRLREEDASSAASRVAAIPGVRTALLGFQRNFAADPPPGPKGAVAGVVLDGRDIGTVVCPDANVKFS